MHYVHANRRKNEQLIFILNFCEIFYFRQNRCTLAASHAASGETWWVRRRDRQTDGRTMPDRYITLSAIDTASVIIIRSFSTFRLDL